MQFNKYTHTHTGGESSSTSLRHLVAPRPRTAQRFHKAAQTGRMVLDGAFSILAADQHSYFRFFSKAVLGLQPPPFKIQTVGGSTVLKDDYLSRLNAHVRKWCRGDPRCLEPIFRGSSDGLPPSAFHTRCSDNQSVHNNSGTGGGSHCQWWKRLFLRRRRL